MTQPLTLNIVDRFILKKYEGEHLFEVLLLDETGKIVTKITDEELLKFYALN
jgi:hypothetical protein